MTSFGSSVVASVLIDLTNETRARHGLTPLRYNEKLVIAATKKGEDMQKRHYFAHFAPDGTTPWHWFSVAGYSFLYAGENLAINFHSSKEVEKAWLASPKHRDNILGGQFEDIGIATIQGESNGEPVLFVVQLFGKQDPMALPVPTEHSIYKAALYEKVVFNMTYYVNIFYNALVALIICALFLMIVIEIREQHYKHILYGLFLITIVLVCSGINAHLL